MTAKAGMYGTPEERFWRKVLPSDNGCWEWTSTHLPRGYGNFYFNGSRVYAHRFSYELLIGPIPDGMVVCHRCDNPKCVHPAHLFVGTQHENLLDMQRKGRKGRRDCSHCKRGHDLSVHGVVRKSGKRYCIPCGRMRAREQREAKKQHAA